MNRSSAELTSDVIEQCQRLDAAFAAVTDNAWELEVRSVQGGSLPISQLPFRRWREVEIHLVDLDLGATPQN